MSIAWPSPDAVDRKRYETLMRLDPPTTLYVIYFTPRSGSTWLADLCDQTGVLGRPDEHFNIKAISNIPLRHSVTNLEDYAALIMRRRNVGGVFGFEITLSHMLRTFESRERFLALFGGAISFWLTRSDIVRQALSIVKHKQTAISQNRSGDEARHAAAEAKFVYDAEAIRRATRNLVNMEKRTERFFRDHAIAPHRLDYETLVATPPIEVANTLIRAIGRKELQTFDYTPALQRTGTDKNEDFAARFRNENADYLAELDERRRAPLRR